MKEILFTLFVVALGHVSGQLSFTVDKSVVSKGDSFQLQCVLDPIPPGIILYYEKVVDGAEENTKISTNNQLEVDLPQDIKDRYSLQAVQEGTGYQFTLSVTNAGLADNGKYQCVWQKGQSERVVKEVAITVPVDPTITMNFINGSDTTNVDVLSEGLIFSEDEQADFECIVAGGNPAPVVKILVGDKDISGEVEIPVAKAVESGTGPEGYREVSYTVTAKITGLRMRKEYGFKNIICQAQSSMMGEAMEKKVRIKFPLSAPIIRCESDNFMVHLFKTFTTHCNVTGTVDESRIEYYSRLDTTRNKSIVLEPMERGAQYEPFLYEFTSETADKHTMRLTIQRVYYQDIRSYYFIASNAMGKSNSTINLIKDPAQIINGATTLQSITIISMLLSLLLAMLFQ